MVKKTTLKTGTYTVELTNTDKVLFPDDGITKGDLIDYYHRIADIMLPYLKERPLMMQRFLHGIKEEGFYQKEAGDYFPSWVKRATMKKQDGTTDYVVCDNTATLVYLAEQDCITPHTWLSRVNRPDNPDLMIFDLDPSDGAFEPVRRAALSLRELLSKLGLAVFVKTTGSRGLHVVVPLDRSSGFDAVRTFAEDIAKLMASRDTEHLTIEQRKEKRHDYVYIDTMRNSYGQTAVAPYAVRAKPRAPVATPLNWEELQDPGMNAQSYTMTNIFSRFAKMKDPWDKLWHEASSLNGPRRHLKTLIH
jgi:bifunctional non-homologous end joining protein LigD